MGGGRRLRGPLTRALENASYEVLPLRSAEESVVMHVPLDVPLTVTSTEAKGLTPTLELTERLAGHGYRVAPHLAARLVKGLFALGRDHPVVEGSWPCAGMGVAETTIPVRTTSFDRDYGLAA